MIKLAVLLRLIAALVGVATQAAATGTDVSKADVDAAFQAADLADTQWEALLPKERTSEVGNQKSASDIGQPASVSNQQPGTSSP